MSEDKNIIVDDIKTVAKSVCLNRNTPIVLKKENKIKILPGENSTQLLKNIKFGSGSSPYIVNIIFESKPGDLIRDSPVKITIVNHVDLLKKTTRTILSYIDQLNGKLLSEKTSDQISKFIGQNNYEAVIAALLSVTDEEVKIKAIMALLTKESFEDQSTQTVSTGEEKEDSKIGIKNEPKVVEEKCCQTDENCMDLIYKLKQKKRVKRCVLTPYVVKDPPEKIIKKVVVNPNRMQHRQIITNMDKQTPTQTPTSTSFDNSQNRKEDKILDEEDSNLPVIQLDEETNDSISTLTGSLCSESLLHNADKILQSIGEHTTSQPTTVTILNAEKHYIKLPNGASVEVPVKPEYPFHMATPEILNFLNNEDKVKVVAYQAYLDFKLCLQADADGYLPIHLAVMNNDLDLLRRQCVVLRYRDQSLDIPAGNLTALQMSIFQDTPQCTAMLLQNGADPLLTDEEHRTCLHLAAESTSDNLRAVISCCEGAAREILQENEDLWQKEYEEMSKDILAAKLMKHMCEMSDSQGYTPLMLAAKSGNYTAVKMLIEASPDCINLQMPNSGNTALFLAVEGACHDANNRGNKSKVADRYNRTISILLESGSELSVANHSGTTINDLLADNNNAELSTLFANKVTSKYFDGQLPGGSQFDSFMLLKNKDGSVGVTEVKPNKTESDSKKRNLNSKVIVTNVTKATGKIKKEKPIILENITLTPQSKVIDPKILNNPQNRLIGTKDKLFTINQIPDSKITTKVVNKVVSQEEFIKAQAFGGIVIKETATFKPDISRNAGVTIKRIQTPKGKRKRDSEPGPSVKKAKAKLVT